MARAEDVLKSIKQQPYQEFVEVDGQRIELPYTNSVCQVILKGGDGGWEYVTRQYWQEPEERRKFFVQTAEALGQPVVANSIEQYKKFERL